jgi:hypothetical protein
VKCYDQVGVDRNGLTEGGEDMPESQVGCTEMYSEVSTAGKLRVQDDVRLFGICPESICIEELKSGMSVQ